MYGVGAPEELAPLKRGGFNCFQTYAGDPALLAALAAEAEKQGMKMVASPDQVIGSTYAAAAKGWPMLAWYLYDEPEVHKKTLAYMEQLDKRVKDWDPAQPTTFVLSSGLPAFTYGAVADALMVDWYPVLHFRLESVGYQVNLVKEAAKKLDIKRPDKPVWAVLQAFDWMEYPQLRNPPAGRFPTRDEVRFMTYISVLRGAGGIFYFTLRNTKGELLYDQPERWAFYEKTAWELNHLLPALDGGERLPAPEGLDAKLAAGIVKGGGRRFLIMTNPTERPVLVKPEVLDGWRPLFEEHRDVRLALKEYKGHWWMMPYKVLVLEKRRRFLLF
ncbi:MAG TPA: hypothetical protein DCZ92_02370 [Elusimicrobia bacterium]|nr:MAG: hypothetical protein A2016_00390 [Elusimicrobia bacterium GWF2_62_30]HBA59669.1 hypothetical protein [Elusimicrobiota bacterium]